MLKINTKNSQEGKFFAYTKGVEFKIRPLTGQVLRELRKKVTTTRMEADPTTRKMVAVEDVDNDKLDELIADYMLEDWKGIGDEAGVPLPVCLESKKSILNQIPLREFIWSAAQALDIEQEQEKN